MAHFYLKSNRVFKIKKVSNFHYHNILFQNFLFQPKKAFIILGFVMSFIIIVSNILIPWFWYNGYSYHNIQSLIYGATAINLYSLSWALILFYCATGNLPLINRILSKHISIIWLYSNLWINLGVNISQHRISIL
jgi:hypothetical protein